LILLGIETSCDETSVALLQNQKVVQNIVASQLLHQEYGGVVPEFASREHVKLIQRLTHQAFKHSRLAPQQIDGVAVTRGPGLMGALLVGLSFAKGIAFSLGKPLLGVNHIEGHIMANFLDHDDLKYPFLCLLVSGGHTQIIHVQQYGEYQIYGRSRDDAAGEAFDKAARILNLGYPGGPVIDRLALKGNPQFYHFPRARIKGDQADFSFSGLKTSMLYLVKRKGIEWAEKNIHDLCASYQEAIVDVLCTNLLQVADQLKIDRLVLAGGVAANHRMRKVMSAEAQKAGYRIYFPSLPYCTDNAAMIARTGLEMLKRNQVADFHLSAVPNLSLSNS